MIQRRSFITGLILLVAAPAIVRAGSLMPVRSMVIEPYGMASSLLEAQRLINLRRSATLKYLKDNLFQPYEPLVDSLLTNRRFVEAIDANGAA